MIQEGAEAPAFELPAVVGGEVESVALESFLGRDVVVLAFYPGDFNPACDGETTDLDELDLFTMQKDVSVLGISGDSVHSHRAFADEYDLKVPLLTDARGRVAADYGVAVEDDSAGYLVHRAVVVVGPEGEVQYAWSTEDLEELPPVEHIREAVGEVGGAETAIARYRVGHAHYVEGRRAFTSAMGNFEDNEWMMAQSDFRRAYDEFDEAAGHFNTAARFAEDDHDIGYFELAEEKAELLWQAAEWLTDAASAYASGEGAEGQAMRHDAEGTLEEARRFPEPVDPDEFPPDEPPPDPAEAESDEEESFLHDDEEDVDTTLELDEAEPEEAEDLRETVAEDESPDDATAEAAGETADGEDEEPSIDEAELEEITAELEEQTEAANAAHEAEQRAEAANGEGGDDEAPAETTDGEREGATTPEAAESPSGHAGAADDRASEAASPDHEPSADENGPDGQAEDDEPVELELTDPTDGEGLEPLEDDEDDEEEEESSEDLGDGGHGVPDSL